MQRHYWSCSLLCALPTGQYLAANAGLTNASGMNAWVGIRLVSGSGPGLVYSSSKLSALVPN